MSLSAVDWAVLRPGMLRWLQRLYERGYLQGATLAEGPYLQGDADGSVTAEKILLACEAVGFIRRGPEDPSHSQLAFTSLGGMATKRGMELPATWYAWHPAADWSVVAKCWTHG